MGRTRGQKCPQSRQIGQCAFPQHAIAAEGWHWRLVRQWFLTTREDTGGPVWTSLDQSPVPPDRFNSSIREVPPPTQLSGRDSIVFLAPRTQDLSATSRLTDGCQNVTSADAKSRTFESCRCT